MHLTVIPEDKAIYLDTPNAVNVPTIFPERRIHTIEDQEFWNSVDPRIHAIQYHTDGVQEIEYKNPGENVAITDSATVQKYIDKFNSVEQVYQAQLTWDNNNVQGETNEQKIARLGPRP